MSLRIDLRSPLKLLGHNQAFRHAARPSRCLLARASRIGLHSSYTPPACHLRAPCIHPARLIHSIFTPSARLLRSIYTPSIAPCTPALWHLRAIYTPPALILHAFYIHASCTPSTRHLTSSTLYLQAITLNSTLLLYSNVNPYTHHALHTPPIRQSTPLH